MLPIELIMIIYKYSNCEEKAILNQCFKLNYKKFNPILGLPLSFYQIKFNSEETSEPIQMNHFSKFITYI